MLEAIKGFLTDKDGTWSSTRLFMLLVCLSTIVDWQRAVWTVGAWTPNITLLIFISSVLGIKVVEKWGSQ